MELIVSGIPGSLAPSIDLSAYRVIQEAMTNVMTHASGSKAQVEIEYSEDQLRVTVTNDGSGTDTLAARTSGGRGIVGMRERTLLFGGEFEAGPIEGGEDFYSNTDASRGWRVHATFPF